MDLQVERDGPGLSALLAAEDPAVRARAALALASVQEPDVRPELEGLLEDPESSVRLEAAFALGQIPVADGGARLLDALEQEGDEAVRIRLIEALGKQGDESAVRTLLERGPSGAAEDIHLTMALSRSGVRRVLPPGLVEALAERLAHPEADVRKAAAYFFGRSGEAELWREEADRMRAALDGYGRDDPAAMQLLVAIGLLQDAEDAERLVAWLSEGEDWRIRTMAARALATTPFVHMDEVIDALFQRVEGDPSVHVAVQSAGALTQRFFMADAVERRIRRVLREGALDRWQAQLPFAGHLVQAYEPDVVLHWARRVQGHHPRAAIRAVEQVGGLGTGEATAFLLEMTDHRDAGVRAAALATLGERWRVAPMEEEEMVHVLELLAARVRAGEPVEAVQAARALAQPTFLPLGSAGLGLEAARQRVAHEDSPAVLAALLGLLAGVGHEEGLPLVEGFLTSELPRIRAAAAEAYRQLGGTLEEEVVLPDPERTVDWEALGALGSEPRLILETDRGEIVVRLVPEQAPLTVQTVVELAREGRYDGTPFHRVVPNFVAQGGDYSLGDGSGSPGFAIRSEFTRVPFHRGVLGMASAGKDTEGSQFFLTHSAQPHLDGAYTAFGWVESGIGAMDALLEGDRIRRARVVADDRD